MFSKFRNSSHREIVGRLALLAATLAVLFCGAELAIRNLYQMENLGNVVIFDPVVGWKLKPFGFNRSVDRARGTDYRISINSMGMREREVDPVKPEGRTRIIHIGDSVAFGLGVGDAWRCSDFMARALPDDVEVINAAVPGWGTDQEVLYFENVLLGLQPDVVVLTFTMVNDVINNALNHLFLGQASKPRFELNGSKLVLADKVQEPRHGRRVRVRNFLRKSQFLVFLKRRMMRTEESVAAGDRGVFPLGFAQARPWEKYSHWSMFEKEQNPALDAAWDVTEALLLRLQRSCQRAGAELVVFAFPLMEADQEWLTWLVTESGVDAGELDFERPFERLARFCSTNQIRYLYPIEEFRHGAERRKLFLEKDGHPNEFGHALAAQSLLSYLRENLNIQYELTHTDLVFLGNP